MKTQYWIILLVAAAFAVAAFLYFNNQKKKPAAKKEEPDAEASLADLSTLESLPAGGSGGGGGGFGGYGSYLADVSGMYSPVLPPIRVQETYAQQAARRLGAPVRVARTLFRPLPGSNTVTTPSGSTATIHANPNAPRFN